MNTETGKRSHSCDFKRQELSHQCDQLSELQQKAISLLLRGKTQEKVAEEIGVTRETINRWLNHNPFFVANLNKRWQQLQVEAAEAVTSLQMAVELVEEALQETDCMQNLKIESAFNKIKTFFSCEGCKELVLTVKAERQPVMLEQTLHKSRNNLVSHKLNPLTYPPVS